MTEMTREGKTYLQRNGKGGRERAPPLQILTLTSTSTCGSGSDVVFPRCLSALSFRSVPRRLAQPTTLSHLLTLHSIQAVYSSFVHAVPTAFLNISTCQILSPMSSKYCFLAA